MFNLPQYYRSKLQKKYYLGLLPQKKCYHITYKNI